MNKQTKISYYIREHTIYETKLWAFCCLILIKIISFYNLPSNMKDLFL